MTLSIIFEMAGHLNTSIMGFRLQTQCCSEPLFQSEAKCNRKGFALSLVLKVNVYAARQKLPIVDKSLVATVLARAGMGGGGGYSWEFLVGVCSAVLQILILFQTKKCHSTPVFRPDL